VPDETRYFAVNVLTPGVRLPDWCSTVVPATKLAPAAPKKPMLRLSAAATAPAPEMSYPMRAEPAPELERVQCTMTTAETPVVTVTEGPARAGASRSVKLVEVVVPESVSRAPSGTRSMMLLVPSTAK